MARTNADVVSVEVGDGVEFVIAPSRYAPHDMLTITAQGRPVASAFLNDNDSVILKRTLLAIGDALDDWLVKNDEEKTEEFSIQEPPMNSGVSWKVLIGNDWHDLYSYRDALDFARENAQGKSAFVYSPSDSPIIVSNAIDGEQVAISCPACDADNWIDNGGDYECMSCRLILGSYFDGLKDAWVE
jgi:hypothetical protein